MKTQTAAGCALPIQTTQLSRHLVRLYQRLAGEVAKSKTREAPLISPEQAQAGIEHVTGLLALLGANFVPEELNPIRTRPVMGLLPRGAIRNGVLRALSVKGSWLSVADIVQRIVAQHCLVLTPRQRRRLHHTIKNRAAALRKTGLLEREHSGPDIRKQRWRINPSVARAPASSMSSEALKLSQLELRSARQSVRELPRAASPCEAAPSFVRYR